MRTTTVLSALLLISTALASTAAAEPAARLDSNDFTQPLADSGWHFFAWSRPSDAITALVADSGDGKQGKALKIDAVDAGACGLVSKNYQLGEHDQQWLVSVRVKRSTDYAGNLPWCFVAACDAAGAFLPPAVTLDPQLKLSGNWETHQLSVLRSQLPAGTFGLTFNLTTAAVKGVSPGGSLWLDDVVIEVVR